MGIIHLLELKFNDSGLKLQGDLLVQALDPIEAILDIGSLDRSDDSTPRSGRTGCHSPILLREKG